MPAESGSTIGYLVDDYNTLLDLYWGNEVLGFKLDLGHHMMQVQYTLNAPVNSVKAGELYPMDVTYVFFVPAYGDVTSDYVVRGMRDFIHGSVDDLTTEAEVVTKPWTGDKVIAPEYMDEVMSVEDAVYTLKLSNVTATDTPYVILHLPFYLGQKILFAMFFSNDLKSQGGEATTEDEKKIQPLYVTKKISGLNCFT